MSRKLRVEYPGAIYHVMSRGDRREPVFHDDADREQFLVTLGEACQKAVWEVHAFCLMPNHCRLVIEAPQGGLVAGMQWLLGTYTGRFNRRHKVCGHWFSGRYKALIVDGSGDGHLKTVCDYAHLNPARARLRTAKEPPRAPSHSRPPIPSRPAGKPPGRTVWACGSYRRRGPKFCSASGRRGCRTMPRTRQGAVGWTLAGNAPASSKRRRIPWATSGDGARMVLTATGGTVCCAVLRGSPTAESPCGPRSAATSRPTTGATAAAFGWCWWMALFPG